MMTRDRMPAALLALLVAVAALQQQQPGLRRCLRASGPCASSTGHLGQVRCARHTGSASSGDPAWHQPSTKTSNHQ